MELKILDWIQALHNPVTDVLFVWITRLGNVGMIWILLAAVLLLRRKTRKTGDILAAALVVDVLLCNGLLKHLFHRVRPCDVNTAVSLLVSRPTDYSFPSGHTLSSAIGATILTKTDRRFGYAAIPLAALIAFSRLYLYVHWPSDVLAGALLGILIGNLTFLRGGRGLDRLEEMRTAGK